MADDLSRLKVWANADTPDQTLQAREYGVQGIGFCRIEHMFVGERTEKFQVQSLCWRIALKSCNMPLRHHISCSLKFATRPIRRELYEIEFDGANSVQ